MCAIAWSNDKNKLKMGPPSVVSCRTIDVGTNMGRCTYQVFDGNVLGIDSADVKIDDISPSCSPTSSVFSLFLIFGDVLC
jgi:hypothetical protein